MPHSAFLRTCEVCGQPLTRRPTEGLRAWLVRRFCGYRCLGAWHRKDRVQPSDLSPRHAEGRPRGEVDLPASVIEAKLAALARERRRHPVYTLDVNWNFGHRYTGGVD